MYIDLRFGDAIEQMKLIPDNSIDCVITDPPYGTTTCKWDTVINFELMWEQLNRIIKPNGAIILFGSEPFTSFLRISNIKNFKYDWYWRKSRPSGYVNAKLKPLKDIETISVFSTGATANGSKRNMPYYPQGLTEVNKKWKRSKKYGDGKGVNHTRKSNPLDRIIKYEGYPRQILDYSQHNIGQLHETQKPTDLLEYLIKTYSNENEIILDFTFGSCSTGIACINTNRNFIGVENDIKHFNISLTRLSEKRKETEFILISNLII